MKLVKPFTPHVIARSDRKGFDQSIYRMKEQKTSLQSLARAVVPNRGGIPPQGGISWVQWRNFYFIVKWLIHCKCCTSFWIWHWLFQLVISFYIASYVVDYHRFMLTNFSAGSQTRGQHVISKGIFRRPRCLLELFKQLPIRFSWSTGVEKWASECKKLLLNQCFSMWAESPPWARFWWARGGKNREGDRGAKQHKGGDNAPPLIDHWVYFSRLLLWLVCFLQIVIYYYNLWRL